MIPIAGAGQATNNASLSVVVREASERLGTAGIDCPRVDAELLMAHVLQRRIGEVRAAIITGSHVLNAAERSAYLGLVARRVAREPLQHLTGRAPFRELDLAVGPGVFVPRPETEAVAQVAIDAARAVARSGAVVRVVDLCTGSGAIALAVATEVPEAQVWAVELDVAAHTWAERNVAEVLTAHPRAMLTLVRGDARTALRELDGTIDVVVSNPPYVPGDAVPKDPEVAVHDPAVALYGLGPDGLGVPRGIAAAAARLVRDEGSFVMEHAEVQAAAARQLLEEQGAWHEISTRTDLTGRPRMVVGLRSRRLVKDSAP